MKIGMFDSGVGGLTVLKEFLKLMPNNEYIYVGDSKRLPYGNKSNENIIIFAKQITEFLIKQDVDIIIVACGTVSSVALDKLKQDYNIPIIGVIEPTAKEIANKYNSILVIATNATINSKMWQKTILENNNKINIYLKACPLFVPIVEEGIIDGIIAEEIINYYLNQYKNRNIDAIILGCTHYPILATTITKIVGNKIDLIDSGVETAKYVYDNYKNHNSKYKLSIFLSDINNNFIKLGNKLLDRDINDIVNKIDFE